MYAETSFLHFSSPGWNGFLNYVSITFVDKTDPSYLLNKKTIGEELAKPWYLLGLILKMVFGQL